MKQMKKVFSLTLTLALLLSVLAIPAAAASKTQSYFTTNSFTVMQETPQLLEMAYAIWERDNEANYMAKTGDFSIESCTVQPAAQPGYQIITLTTLANMEEYYDEVGDVNYTTMNWSNGIYDYYTGERFNFVDMLGSGKTEYTKTITWGGKDYLVSYSKENEWVYPNEWEWSGDGSATKALYCESTNIFTVPTGYNGLVYGLHEATKPESIDTTEEVSTEVSYADKTDVAQYFRFGHKQTEALPREGLGISIYDQGLWEGLGYSVTNHGTETIAGYYALLSYWPVTVYYPAVTEEVVGVHGKSPEHEYFAGQLLSLDVDLAPGETVSGDCWAVAVGWSTMTHLWVRFDNKAERDAFLKNEILKPAAGSWETGGDTLQIDGTEAGIQWMQDNFSITIKSGKPA